MNGAAVAIAPTRYERAPSRPPTDRTTSATEEERLVEALRRGDDDAFRRVVIRYHSSLVRTARSFVRSSATAEEVAQDTWLAVIRGISAFEGRSSFKTWLFRILVNQAVLRGKSDARVTPESTQIDGDEPGAALRRFHGADDRARDRWRAASADWGALPEVLVSAAETGLEIEVAIATLPAVQCRVITMRDVTGLTPAEVCHLLDISEGNQRVLLHRARTRVRTLLETQSYQSEASLTAARRARPATLAPSPCWALTIAPS